MAKHRKEMASEHFKVSYKFSVSHTQANGVSNLDHGLVSLGSHVRLLAGELESFLLVSLSLWACF